MTKPGAYKAFLLIWLAFSLVACSPGAAPSPSATTSLDTATPLPGTATPEPTKTFTPLPPTDTATATTPPTATSSPTATLTATPTPTATLTPTPTVAMVMPGQYNTGGCSLRHPSIPGSGDIDYEFCVVSVEVTSERHMIFNVSWKVNNIDAGYSFTKTNDKGNDSIYLIDNLGNHYNHIAGGGAAYGDKQMNNNQVATGWFDFGKPKLGAISFSFYDEGNGITIKAIPLFFPTIVFEAFQLQNFPLQLEYSPLKWAVGSLADGSQGLVHQKIQGCTIQERPSSQPQGNLLNIGQEIGDATYAIYGRIDTANNVGYREYVVLGGAELIQGGQPFFLVTIPLDNSTICVYDASDVLAKLGPRQP